MTTTTLAQETAFNAAVALSESVRQGDVGLAKAALVGAALQSAVDGASRGHRGRVVAAATLNNVVAPGHREALDALNRKLPAETFTRSDTTTMTLVGGRYVVAVAATFGATGLNLVNAGGEVFASFAANGTATLDLRYGVYNWVLGDTTGLTATLKNAVY